MINLAFGANIVCLTLTESTTISSPVYLFEFINDLTLDSVVFITSDTSSFKERYNQFTIELVNPGSVDLLSGKIYLKDAGYYSYNVYQQSGTTLDVNSTQGLVETGKVLYEFAPSNTIELESDNEYIVYG